MEKIPIGIWVQDIVNYIVDLSEYHLRLFSDSLNLVIGKTVDALEWTNPFILILIIVILTYIINLNY